MLLKAAAVCLMSDVTQTFTDLGGWEGHGGLRRVPHFAVSGRLGGEPTSGCSKLGERTHPKLEVEHLLTGDVVCAKAEIVACDN
jgi:hypothetical protein